MIIKMSLSGATQAQSVRRVELLALDRHTGKIAHGGCGWSAGGEVYSVIAGT